MALLVNTPYEIKGVSLNITDMMQVAQYYNLAMRQEYIYENFACDEEDAKKIAALSLDRYSQAHENDAIKMAAADLHIDI